QPWHNSKTHRQHGLPRTVTGLLNSHPRRTFTGTKSHPESHMRLSLSSGGLALIAIAVVRAPIGAQAANPRVDAIFAQYDKRDSAGCAVAVSESGKTVFAKGYGMASLEHDLPITPTSAFYAASVSKQFTAFAVAMLAKQGKLSLDDDIRKWFPEVPD